MFIFKRKPSLSQHDMEELKNFVGSTFEVMLSTKEETIHIFEKYDLVLICSWEIDCMEGSLYLLSDFHLSQEGLSSLVNTPLYTERRYFHKNDEGIEYIDDAEIKGLLPQNRTAFYSICELIRIFEVEVHSSKTYTCVWN